MKEGEALGSKNAGGSGQQVGALVKVGPVEAGAILGLVSFAIAVKLLTVLSTVI